MKDKSIVLSRYNETFASSPHEYRDALQWGHPDISGKDEWEVKLKKLFLEELLDHFDIYVYDKGSPPLSMSKEFRYQETLNIGREAETFLKHIIENYDHLSEYVVFSQADPYPHTYRIDGGYRVWDNTIFVKKIYTFPKYVDAISSVWSWHPKKPMHKEEEIASIFIHTYFDEVPEKIQFAEGGIYIVTKQCIHKIPKNFYQYLYSELVSPDGLIDAWVMERMWGFLFHPDSQLNEEGKYVQPSI